MHRCQAGADPHHRLLHLLKSHPLQLTITIIRPLPTERLLAQASLLHLHRQLPTAAAVGIIALVGGTDRLAHLQTSHLNLGAICCQHPLPSHRHRLAIAIEVFESVCQKTT